MKQLLVLKEKKKLNFEFILSKCLSEIIIPEEKNKNLINRKKVNLLLEDFNKEFNYYQNFYA